MKQTKESPEKAEATGNGEGIAQNIAQQANGGERQDAISMLKADHREAEQLFERYATVKRRAERAKIAKQACNALTIHAILEEEIFYPACRELIDDEPLDEAQVEHDSAKVLINELTNGSPEDPFFDAKFKVLAEQVKHHIQEEEGRPDSIFAKVEAAGADLTAIGEQLKERKAQLANLVGRGAVQAEVRSFTSAKNLIQGEQGARSSQRGGREDESRASSRYRDEEDAGRRRDDQGRFMGDEDDGHRRGQERSYREGSERERDRGYRSSSQGRAPYAQEGHSSRGERTPERDEHGRFVSDEEQPGQGRSRAREDEHERRSYRDEDERRGASSQGGGRRYEQRSREDENDDDRRGHSGWFGDPEGHAEASRRGWEHRR